jgi:hypothetical protein
VIRYALVCEKGHGFESWFQSSKAYDAQAARGLIDCPVCGSSRIEKALMAPAVAKPARRPPSTPLEGARPKPEPEQKTPVAVISEKERELRTRLKELRDHIVKNADYVGGQFPEEARRMHYGEIEHRSIYGEASPQEAEALVEEGIELHPLPVLPEDRN